MGRVKFSGFAGLRVFAIAMVVACHVGILASSAGGIGNKIFFCLSGFLAYFSLKRIESAKGVGKFYLKKIVRILPSYYILLIFAAIAFPSCIYLTSLTSSGSLLMNMLFIKNFGHLWFLQQIMLMYLVSPILILIVKLVDRVVGEKSKSRLISVAILLVMAVLEKKYFTADVLRLSGEGSHPQFAVWMFIAGFCTALLYEEFIDKKKIEEISSPVKWIVGIYEVLFFAVLFVMVIPQVREIIPNMSQVFDDGVLRTVLSCLAIMGLAITPANRAKDFLDNKFFAIVSDCSFEIYIIHFFLIEYFAALGIKRRFVAVCFISFCVAFTVHAFTDKVLLKKKAN